MVLFKINLLIVFCNIIDIFGLSHQHSEEYDCKPSQYSRLVVITKHDDLVCAGSLLSPDWVLTTSRCCQKMIDLEHHKIYAGMERWHRRYEQVSLIDRKFVNENSNKSSIDGVCLLELKSPMVETEKVRFNTISATWTFHQLIDNCRMVTVMGFSIHPNEITVSNETTLSNEILSNETLSNETSNETLFNETLSNETSNETSNKTLSNETSNEALSNETLSTEILPSETLPNDALPDETLSNEELLFKRVTSKWISYHTHVKCVSLELSHNDICMDQDIVSEAIMCATDPTTTGIGNCYGDEGSPLICNHRQIGILFDNNRGCGSKKSVLYIRLDLYADFISNTLKQPKQLLSLRSSSSRIQFSSLRLLASTAVFLFFIILTN